MIRIENAVAPEGGLRRVNCVTASSTVRVNDCATDKSTFTLPPEISSSSTYSEYVLNLADPSISTFALGVAVPNPV